MNIWGITSAFGSGAANAVKSAGNVQEVAAAKASAGRGVAGQGVGEVHDSVTLSIDAVRSAESAGEIRFDRVQAIRTAIAEGTYETPEKLDLAMERLLDRLG